MRVIIARVGEEPVEQILQNSLEAMQEVVGGPIELFSVEDLDFWVCEQGIPMGMPPNMVVMGVPLVGTVMVAASDAEGETVSLTDTQCRKAFRILRQSPRLFIL